MAEFTNATLDLLERMAGAVKRDEILRAEVTTSGVNTLAKGIAALRAGDAAWYGVKMRKARMKEDDFYAGAHGGTVQWYVWLERQTEKNARGISATILKNATAPTHVPNSKKEIEEWIARDAEKAKIPLIQRRNPKREIVWPSTVGGHEEQWFGWWAQNESMNEMFAKGYISRRTMLDANFMWGPPRETWTRELVEQVVTVWAGETEETGKEPIPDGWLGQFKACAQKSGWL